jgi:hypothetical protein
MRQQVNSHPALKTTSVFRNQSGLCQLWDTIMHTEASTTDRLLPDDQTTRKGLLGQTALDGC